MNPSLSSDSAHVWILNILDYNQQHNILKTLPAFTLSYYASRPKQYFYFKSRASGK